MRRIRPLNRQVEEHMLRNKDGPEVFPMGSQPRGRSLPLKPMRPHSSTAPVPREHSPETLWHDRGQAGHAIGCAKFDAGHFFDVDGCSRDWNQVVTCANTLAVRDG